MNTNDDIMDLFESVLHGSHIDPNERLMIKDRLLGNLTQFRYHQNIQENYWARMLWTAVWNGVRSSYKREQERVAEAENQSNQAQHQPQTQSQNSFDSNVEKRCNDVADRMTRLVLNMLNAVSAKIV